MHPDGSDAHLVASGTAPAWSPDAEWIAYGVRNEIRAVRADGSGDHLVLAAHADRLTWSPDGRFIAYSTGRTIFVVGSDGAGKTRLTTGASPSWQPLPS
jgi:Tol biopolymer transport system component